MSKDILLKVFKDQWLNHKPTAYEYFFSEGLMAHLLTNLLAIII